MASQKKSVFLVMHCVRRRRQSGENVKRLQSQARTLVDLQKCMSDHTFCVVFLSVPVTVPRCLPTKFTKRYQWREKRTLENHWQLGLSAGGRSLPNRKKCNGVTRHVNPVVNHRGRVGSQRKLPAGAESSPCVARHDDCICSLEK